jgi:hypothetical protein
VEVEPAAVSVGNIGLEENQDGSENRHENGNEDEYGSGNGEENEEGDEVEVEVEAGRFEERRNIEGYEQRLIEAIEERTDILNLVVPEEGNEA